MAGFERGFLSKPAVRALLERWTAEEEARRIREQNDLIVTKAITAWFRCTDAAREPSVSR